MLTGKIFNNARLIRLETGKIDMDDRTFAVSWPGEWEVQALAGEIETSGIVTPVWAQEQATGKKFRVIDGFRRVAAARGTGLKELPALIFRKDIDPLILFRARLAGLGSRLSAVETAKVLEKLNKEFQVDENTLVKTFLPLLGLGRNKTLLGRFRRMETLEEPVARYCAEQQVGLAEVSLWAEFPGGAQKAVLSYVRAFNPGGNLLKSYLRLIGEIALRSRTTVEKVLEDPQLRKLLLDPQTARSNGREQMHRRLREMRFPVMKDIEERFGNTRRSLDLPSEIDLKPPVMFEGERLSLSFEIESAGDLAEKSRRLLEAARSGKIEMLFRCLGAPEAEDSETGGETG
jgi:ParB/Sulfiredoxin domain